ncbi:MAG: glycoside hydrolase family 127 protein [Bacteroidota bacterium]|nr:glycoside hydrolase family 127 protein [Bacteroidota bacterium]
MEAIADHFCRSQDDGKDDGLGSYHLIEGWSASYPETTGYIIPTLFALSDHLQRHDLSHRAIRAANWLLSIQHEEGGWQGGRVNEARPSVAFNTAQVIRGMMAAHDRTADPKYLDAAVRASDWIVSVQEVNGSWVKHNFLQTARVYDSYVSAPLLRMFSITRDQRYRNAAIRNLDWALSRQLPNGWFTDADNTIKHNKRPITHTIAYTLDGLLECHELSGDNRYLISARTAADVLLERSLAKNEFKGRFDRNWNGSESPITTGIAQLTIVWQKLHKITSDPKYALAANRSIKWLKAVQAMSFKGPIDAKGAITGSFPLWGRYEKFACPNWAQKYFADALLCANGQFPKY